MSSNPNPPPDDLASSARRRLLMRGGFAAAPAVLTLYSGGVGAQAANSSINACVRKQSGVRPALAVTEAESVAGTVWIRVQLWTVGGGNNQSVWVKGSDLVTKANEHKPTPLLTTASGTAWYLYSAQSNSPYSGQPAGYSINTAPTANGNGNGLAQNGAWVAVLVSYNGQIVGFVSPDVSVTIGAGGNVAPASTSCFTSIRPLA